MTREKFRNEMVSIVPRYDELVKELRTYGKERFAVLHKYFCPSVSYPWGVESITCHWQYNGFHCEVKWSTRSYSTSSSSKYHSVMESDNWYYKEKGYDLHSMTEEQMSAVVKFIKDTIAENEKKLAAIIEKGKNAMSIEDLQSECEKVANELLKDKKTKYGDKLRAKLSVGRRLCDGNENYTALCIEYYGNEFGNVGWHYLGGIRLYKDKYGVNQMTEFRPLCGQSIGEFNWEWFKRNILSYAA